LQEVYFWDAIAYQINLGDRLCADEFTNNSYHKPTISKTPTQTQP